MIAMNNFEEFARLVGYDIKALRQKDTGHEIRGTGSPEGRVVAEIGATYVDINATNGALKWIKRLDDGNTGWRVLWGDTGWRDLATESTLNIGRRASSVRIRRVNNLISFSFGGLEKDRFGIIRRDGNGFVGQNGNKGVRVIAPKGIPDGFRSRNSLIGNIFSDTGQGYGIWYLGGRSDSNYMHFTFNDDIPTNHDIDDIRVSAINYFTEDPWPTTLP